MNVLSPGAGYIDQREYLQRVRSEIGSFRNRKPSVLSYAGSLITFPLHWMIQKIIPSAAIEGVLAGLDWCAKGTLWRPSSSDFESLVSCDVAATAVINRHMAVGVVEGGIAGAIGIFAIPADVPALIGLALRLIRQVGVEYGYETDGEAERQFVLNILAVSTANTQAEKAASILLLRELSVMLAKQSWKAMAAKSATSQLSKEAALTALRALAKQLGMNLTKRKALEAIPVIGAAIGATSNGWFLREVGEAAQRLYQDRWLRDRNLLLEGEVEKFDAGLETVDAKGSSNMDTVQQATSTTASPLKQLDAYGQSPWLDFIQRSFTGTGLQKIIDEDGLKGITSNPAIFEKAMGHGTDYDAGFKTLAEAGDHDALGLYETLAIEDIQEACDRMHPVYEATGKVDGYVSLEVSPYLALRTDETVEEARRLWKAVNRPNLMVKVPGTDKCVPAIRTLIADGININVTLLFAQSAYEAVAESFIAGLEDRVRAGGDIAGLSSVASFFVSRIDAVMDKKIDESGKPELKALRGKIAIANAKLAYQHYLGLVASPRWQALAAKGALPQRLLWASTGVKDKAYSDVLYVEELIGRDTVNTIPPATMDAFRDHGTLRDSLVEDVEGARTILADADKAGLDLPGVALKLVEDGVKLFAEAADKLLGAVATKRTAMLGDKITSLSIKLPAELQASVDKAREDWRSSGKLRDLWAHDPKVWTGGDEAKWLGWLRVVDDRQADLPALLAFQQDVRAAGYKHVMLLGMGGSSLGPEVLAETFGRQPGFPELLVLDSTDPQQVAAFAAKVDMAHTLFIVSSKSGSTLEPNILKAYFFDQVCNAASATKAGKHFVAVTDPGSKMQRVAEADNFRHIFMGDPSIGGRYSVLSNFGLVPLAAMGGDLAGFLKSTSLMLRSCAAGTPPDTNPGVQLGLALGTACLAGRDKLTIASGPGLEDVGAWLEQLVAESTGKQGHGIVPVDMEALAAPGMYGSDRVFAYMTLAGRADTAQDAAVAAVEQAGHPVIRLTLKSPLEVGQAFYLWEFATAVAGSVIGIDPFDQPDVEASKLETRKLTDAYAKDGHLPPEAPFLEADGIKLFTDDANQAALGKAGLDAVVKAQLDRAKPGDYVAILAYIERTPAHIALLNGLRAKIRDAKHVATVGGFGPRFLHSTGQAYKGGPNSGVFLQITAEDAADLPVPGENYTFGIVKSAQARGDFDVLAERHRRALRIHLGADVDAGLARLAEAIEAALA